MVMQAHFSPSLFIFERIVWEITFPCCFCLISQADMVLKKMFITLTAFFLRELAINTRPGVKKKPLSNVFHYNLAGWQGGNGIGFSILVTSSCRIYSEWTSRSEIILKAADLFSEELYNP